MRALQRFAKWTLGLVASALVVGGLWVGWKRAAIQREDVEFRSGGLTLRGTLLRPRFARQAPGLVLVHGSGATSRKSTLSYAWIFASQGYAALAYDKRGVGRSEGGVTEWREFSFDSLARDAAAAYRFLQAHPGIDPQRLGFVGLSQGGWVVARAAPTVDRPAFLVMVSAALATVAEDRLHGREAQLRHAGAESAAVRSGVELLRLDHSVTRSGTGMEALHAAFARARQATWLGVIDPQRTPPLAADDPHRRWERTILDFDPRPLLDSLPTPVLWIFGDPALDRFAPVQLSVARVERARAAGRPYESVVIPGVGHTLALERGGTLATLLRVRVPLFRRIVRWLDAQPRATISGVGPPLGLTSCCM